MGEKLIVEEKLIVLQTFEIGFTDYDDPIWIAIPDFCMIENRSKNEKFYIKSIDRNSTKGKKKRKEILGRLVPIEEIDVLISDDF